MNDDCLPIVNGFLGSVLRYSSSSSLFSGETAFWSLYKPAIINIGTQRKSEICSMNHSLPVLKTHFYVMSYSVQVGHYPYIDCDLCHNLACIKSF